MTLRSVFGNVATVLLCAALSSACEARAPSSEPPKTDPAFQRYVLGDIPSNLPNRTFIDFEGKVHLIGYAVEPSIAAPGSRIKLTLYWHAVSPLRPGWNLFTHVLDQSGEQLQNVDNEGVLRKVSDSPSGMTQAFPPSSWPTGKVIVDEQEFQIDPNLHSPEIILAVGIWRGVSRLAVISGPADRANRGLVVHMKTGVTSGPKPLANKT